MAMGLVQASQILISTNIKTIIAHKINMLLTVTFTCIGSFSSFGGVEELRCESQGSPFQKGTTTSGSGIRPQYLRNLGKYLSRSIHGSESEHKILCVKAPQQKQSVRCCKQQDELYAFCRLCEDDPENREYPRWFFIHSVVCRLNLWLQWGSLH